MLIIRAYQAKREGKASAKRKVKRAVGRMAKGSSLLVKQHWDKKEGWRILRLWTWRIISEGLGTTRHPTGC